MSEDKIVFDESYDKADFGLIDAGDYEVTLKAEKRTTKDGSKEFLNLTFKIRDDVNQNFKNRCVFDTAWRDKTRQTWFDLVRLNKLVKTQKNEPDYQVEFGDVDECILYLNGAKMRITIDKMMDDYSGKEVNSVRYLSYAPSQAGPVAESPVELADSELPF